MRNVNRRTLLGGTTLPILAHAAGLPGLGGRSASAAPRRPNAASSRYSPIATIQPEIKREGLILANIEDTYGSAAGMEAVAAEYMKLYPKVEVVVDPKPIEGYFDWARAQVATGTDASFMRDCSCPDLVAAGRFVELDPYFASTNPYTDQIWSSMFKPGTIRVNPDTGYVVQFNMFSVYVLWFYNRTLWEQVGLTETPTTWTEFINVLQTFQDAGILPTPMAGDVDGWARMGISWLDRITADAYARDTINIVRSQPGDWSYDPAIDDDWVYDPTDPYNDAYGEVTRNPIRMIAAFRDGTLTVDNPGYQDWWQHLKQFLQYIQPGFLGVNRETARQLFLTGQAGIWMDASWFFSQFEKFMDDPSAGLNRFEYGTFNLVNIDDSPLVQAPTRTIDNPAGYWVVPKKDQAQNDLEIDFLMFLSTPEMAGLLVEHVLTDPRGDLVGPPTVNNVELDEVWAERFSVVGGRGQAEDGAPGIHGLDPDGMRQWVDLAQRYAVDEMSEDEFFQGFQASIMESVPRVAAAQGYNLDDPAEAPNPPQ